MSEKYKPSLEEIENAKNMMTNREGRMSEKSNEKIISQLSGVEKKDGGDFKLVKEISGKNLSRIDFHTIEDSFNGTGFEGTVYFYDGKRLPIEYSSSIRIIEEWSGRCEYFEGYPQKSPDEAIDFVEWAIESKKDPIEKETFNLFKKEQKKRREKFGQEIKELIKNRKDIIDLVKKDPEYLDRFNLKDILDEISKPKFRLIIEGSTPAGGDFSDDLGIYDSKEEAEEAAEKIMKEEYESGARGLGRAFEELRPRITEIKDENE